MDIIKSATLSNVQIELMPNVGWREAAKRGKISMSYKICGIMEVAGLGRVFVRARIANPDYTDLGGFVTGRSAKNPPVLDDGQKFDALELVTETVEESRANKAKGRPSKPAEKAPAKKAAQKPAAPAASGRAVAGGARAHGRDARAWPHAARERARARELRRRVSRPRRGHDAAGGQG